MASREATARSSARAPASPAEGEQRRDALRIAMLLHKSVVHDTRVRREASALADAGHDVTVVHLPSPDEDADGLPGAPFALRSATLPAGRERIPRPLRLGAEALRLAGRAAAIRPDAIHAHDAAMLLPGLLAARRCGARLVYDSHELATGVPYRRGPWSAIVSATERLGAPRADATIAVSEGIARELSSRYRLRAAPAVVRNVPDLPPPGASPAPELRRKLGVGDAPLILHQGAVAPGRGCETLIQASAAIPDAHLLFLGADGPYARSLVATAAAGGVGDRVHVHGPVPPESLLSHTAQADIGVSLLENSCENHRLALPNKLFEYIAAGLPVVVSDLPEVARLVRKRQVGWCVDAADPASVAAGLRAALEHQDDETLRRHLDAAARELRWERERERLLEVYENIPAPTAR